MCDDESERVIRIDKFNCWISALKVDYSHLSSLTVIVSGSTEMSVRVAILALLVGVLSVVAEYTQPTIWPQVSGHYSQVFITCMFAT